MKNKYTIFTILGLVLWVLETAFFGWNEHAQSSIERILDMISWLFILWGIIGDITRNLTIIKTTNVSTENVKIITDKEIDDDK